MSETSQTSPLESDVRVRIVGLNTDKTRRTIGSDTLYQVYFELSESPPLLWRTAFEQEWKGLSVGMPLALQEASVGGAFLVMNCTLHDISRFLPVLKEAVASTNKIYGEYVLKQSEDQKKREDVWKDERKKVEDIAKSLHFE